jgi:hypothetical protein
MRAAREEPPLTSHPVVRGQPLYAVSRVDVGVQRELDGQFDSAIAFADFCTFLTSGRLSDQAAQLVSVAQELLAETRKDLQRSRRPL